MQRSKEQNEPVSTDAGPITLVLGASLNPSRASHSAVRRLARSGHSVYAVGRRPGHIEGITVHTTLPEGLSIDTVTLYLGAPRQAEYADALIGLKPRRIIFNPGAENAALAQAALHHGIEVMNACTLVMVSLDTY